MKRGYGCDRRSKRNCFVKVMLGEHESHGTLRFLAQRSSRRQEVVLGSTLCELCFYEVVLGSTLRKFCTTK